MYRYLKHQETLQASIPIQNLNSSAFFSPPQIYLPTQPILLIELQVVPFDLEDIQPHSSKVWNCDGIGFDPNGNCNNMVCTYKFFAGDSIWMTRTGEIAKLWCTTLIFTRADGKCSIPPVVVHQRTDYTKDLHYNITSDWVIHNSPSGYIYCGGWHKFMSHFASNCLFSPLNNEVLFYNVHDRHFYDSSLDILCKYNIQSFILKAGDSVHDQPNYNVTNMTLKNMYVNAIINCMRKHGTLKFALAHMNSVLVATW